MSYSTLFRSSHTLPCHLFFGLPLLVLIEFLFFSCPNHLCALKTLFIILSIFLFHLSNNSSSTTCRYTNLYSSKFILFLIKKKKSKQGKGIRSVPLMSRLLFVTIIINISLNNVVDIGLLCGSPLNPNSQSKINFWGCKLFFLFK